MGASRWPAYAAALGVVLALSGCSAGQDGAVSGPTTLHAGSAPTTPPSSEALATEAGTDPAAANPCRPAEVYPLKCGTFRSTYGGDDIRGDRGGPAQDPLEISFTHVDGRLELLARGGCWTATVPMRFVPDTGRSVRPGQQVAQRDGDPRFTTSSCGTGNTARGSWAYPFLHGTLRTTDAETFGKNAGSVFFEYQGSAAIGQPQLPRNELRCVAGHITPFACGEYRAARGSGALAFLGARPFSLTFAHVNGALTASLLGRCNGLSTALQVDGATVVATGGGSTLMGCSGTRATDDDAIGDFFQGVLTVEVDQNAVTFASPEGSATFSR